MPADSSWNMPVVSPEPRRSKVFLSFRGMSSRRIFIPRWSSMSRRACSRMVRFPSPRKSNFNTPSFSSCLSSYCVWRALTLPFERSSGTSCVMGSREHRVERADLRDAVGAVLLRHVLDDLVAAIAHEVDIDVRRGEALEVQEPLEDEAVLERIDVRHADRVVHDRAAGRSAHCGEDPLLVRESDEVLHDEDVTGVAGLRDDRELLIDPLAQLRCDRAVPLDRAGLGEHPELLLRRLSRRHLEMRETPL